MHIKLAVALLAAWALLAGAADAANLAISSLTDVGTVNDTDTFQDCALNGCNNSSVISLRASAAEIAAYLAGKTQTLTNKTLTSPTVNGGALSGTLTGSPAFTGQPSFTGALGTTSTPSPASGIYPINMLTSQSYIISLNHSTCSASAGTVCGIANPTNLSSAIEKSGYFEFAQDSTGGSTMSWGNVFYPSNPNPGSGTPITLPQVCPFANSVTTIPYHVVSTTRIDLGSGVPCAGYYIGPIDNYGTVIACYGIANGCSQANAAATAVAFVAKRASDSTTQNITVLANGSTDVATASTFCNATTCQVEPKDLSGNSNDATTFAGLLVFNCNGVIMCVKGGGWAITLAQGTTNVTAFAAIGNRTANFTTQETLISTFDYTANTGNNLTYNPSANQIGLFGNTANLHATAADSVMHVMIGAIDSTGNASTISVDNMPATPGTTGVGVTKTALYLLENGPSGTPHDVGADVEWTGLVAWGAAQGNGLAAAPTTVTALAHQGCQASALVAGC